MFDYIITKHSMEQYVDRVTSDWEGVKKRIKKDLHFKKIKKIVHNGNHKHVFTLHSKEFIFVVNERGQWILKTVIKRNREYNSYVMNVKREKQKLRA